MIRTEAMIAIDGYFRDRAMIDLKTLTNDEFDLLIKGIIEIEKPIVNKLIAVCCEAVSSFKDVVVDMYFLPSVIKYPHARVTRD